MPPQDPDQQPTGSDHYVELKELRPGEFVFWATTNAPHTRLRSVTGPPGGGKSTFLRQIETKLLPDSRCFLLPPLKFSGSEEVTQSVHQWMDDIGPATRRQGYHEPSIVSGSTDMKQRWIKITGQLPRICSSRTRVLLIDGFDELPVDKRQWVEEIVIKPFLLPGHGDSGTGNRCVIARRDEFALREAVLRWEDDVHPLKGLARDQQTEQIERRLGVIRNRPADEARARLEWPEANDPYVGAEEQAAITTAVNFAVRLNEMQTRALVDLLKDFLTPNPFVNLLLLRRQFLHPVRPLNSNDCQDCLSCYVERSRVPHMTVGEVIGLVQRLANPASFTLRDANNPIGNTQFHELRDAGLVTLIPGTARYRFEPAVIQLVNHI